MRLTIHHKTAYRYAHPVVLQPHRMILRPRGSHDIALLSSSLSCSPDAQLEWTQDVFGNLIATGIFPKPAAELVITSEFTVEQSAVAWPVFRIAPEAHSFPFTYSPDDMAGLGALRIPEHNDPEGRMGAWARAFVRGASTDTLSLLKDLNAGILGSVAYRVRDEEGTQTPLETLALASGSCRDIAALFIDAVRHFGVGARAVSGYLFDAQRGMDRLRPDAPSPRRRQPHSGRGRTQQSPDHADRRRLFRLARGFPRHGCRREGQAGIIAIALGLAVDAGL